MRADRFKRQILALFFIVSVVPALIVGAVWYVYTQTATLNFLFLDFNSFVLPVIMVGIIPAVLLSFVFAELLSRPVREIHRAALELARGDFRPRFGHRAKGGEFAEIGRALDELSAKLQATLSQASSETSLIDAERGKLNTVLNSMTDGVFALDRAGRIILFNKAACELTGRSLSEVAGQLAEKVMPFRSGGELVMTRFLALGGSEHKIGEWKGLELYRGDGHSLYVDVQAVVLKDDPNGIAALVTFHDLTKSHQLEEMKIDFVALAAHELRTPLTEIKGHLDILRTEAHTLTKAQKGFLAQAISSADELGNLMHNLLNVSRIEHGEVSYQAHSIDYGELISETVSQLQVRAEQQKRQLTFTLPTEPVTVKGEASALREVINNLVTNAITHTREDGTITVEVVARRTSIDTVVSDNGRGIPASAIPHLFTKFFRVDELKSTTRGTGLGLYICRSIVEAHKGHISVKSVEGHGTSFTFVLPRAQVATTPQSIDNKRTISRGAHGWIKDHSVR